MEKKPNMTSGERGPAAKSCCTAKPLEMLPLYNPHAQGQAVDDDAPCCGPPAGPPSSVDEKPGYRICGFVEEFLPTAAGPVPRVKTGLARADYLGTLRVRLGIGRNDYKVAPGLYALGRPDADSPVLVTANYKLSFDHLRSSLEGANAWLLVLDTRGINVWCAAGKGTFGTDEVVRRVRLARVNEVVRHRRLILPQLGAPGVSGRGVRKACGYEIVWGPVRASDLQAFLNGSFKAEAHMRRVTFSMGERMVLVPVEMALTRKPLLWVLLAIFVLSGIGPYFFSLSAAWNRGVMGVLACLTGVLSGSVLVPCLLPWIPGRAFAVKGALCGAVAGVAVVLAMMASPRLTMASGTALILLATAASSYVAMNFTGATPFTSPSGVEKEMRRAIPLQFAAILVAIGLWITAAFVR